MGLVPRAHELALGVDAERLLLTGGERDTRSLSVSERIMGVSPFIINQSSAFIPAQYRYSAGLLMGLIPSTRE
ncbi:MAG: hypothetical protein R3D26_23675 [Cyanobacteriota/Melainabacteria group bacterium]